MHGGENVTGVAHIVIAMKPVEAGFAENALLHGVAGINIDECRIATIESLNGGAYAEKGSRGKLSSDEREGAAAGMFQAGKTVGRNFEQPVGRWPANVILGHAEGCVLKGTKKVGNGDRQTNVSEEYCDSVDEGYKRKNRSSFIHKTQGIVRQYGEETVDDWDCVEGCPVRGFPETTSGKPGIKHGGNTGSAYGAESRPSGTQMSGFGDSGSAARFFKQVREMKEEEI